ncbi:MAG: TadE/TadG family type IV pilus assembly protein [Terracidiphilus sp.]
MKNPSEVRGQMKAPMGSFRRALERVTARFKTRSLGERICAGSEGAAMVEMALMFPIFLILMTAIFTFGIAINNQLTLTQAVGAGAQYLQTIRTSTTNPCSDTFTAIKNAAPSLTSSKITVTVTMNGITPTQTGNSCSGAQTDLQQQTPVTVTATYPCNLSIYGKNYAPNGCALSATVTEYEY